ncbi:MAG: helix-turn-helix domain-containing protein [Rhizomicrobium sp.]|jgi:DNA-binding HxlR family transcriptional regulator
MRRTPPATRRSGCPLNAALEMVGDRWSLLVVRDMMLRGASHYADFLNGHERIATNILADRLRKLAQIGIISAARDTQDRRKRIYRLTKKGIALAPVLVEMVLWAASHEATGNQPLVRSMRDKKSFLTAIRARWQDTLQAL